MSIQAIGDHHKDGRLKQPKYTDGRTKQSFKDSTDINKILQRAQKAGTLSHLEKHEGTYGDFADFDFLEAQVNLARGREIFDELPSELRNEFQQNPASFFAFVNDPANAGKLDQKLPALAAPGRQNIDVSGKTPPDNANPGGNAASAAPSPPEAGETPAPPASPPTP